LIKKLNIAAIQMVSSAHVEENLERASKLILESKNRGANFVVLPENFLSFGTNVNCFLAQQEALKLSLAQLAKKNNLWLAAGTMPWLDKSTNQRKPNSSSFVFNCSGEEVLRYDKIHLFDVQVDDSTGSYKESDSYLAGNTPGVFDTPWGKFGIAICYDIRFPEYFRLLAEKGINTLIVPSAFTHVTGEAHWEVLLRARAIENQIFVIAANQGGRHSPSRTSWGESMIINAWGRVLAKCGKGEAIVSTMIDYSELNTLRSEMPVLKHRCF